MGFRDKQGKMWTYAMGQVRMEFEGTLTKTKLSHTCTQLAGNVSSG